MVSDFIEQHDGYLQLSEEEAAHAGTSVHRTVRVLLEYGADKEGYWNSERFMADVADAVAIAEFKYPPQKNTLVFIFDQSSCHKAYRGRCPQRKQNECESWRKAAMHARHCLGRTSAEDDG